ncbi:tRNA (adenosine(37)-N6)-threonylcarbamoyltransferase complex dimerization subunit type 1 TsaB [Paenibacillus harenae]|uniref:tRNA (adenosine(37)-N6)-threonylcarbamoyltransferase complex dimerization subunit type 1 TsaB n=1 Tax=Paenibacillus harenae TaxID=306543 RepID=UPI00278D161D|nr:tRNA (adenosine(37)-N6)-threonylcarbamoyltransferase complex dimerization subunit type 1 TsaB [Paenibacillus harenae]MDQ0063517.1 tRNA threonylcarbamoyladenosine biosynthesis protein TsaB [Paenibacillus harenae]
MRLERQHSKSIEGPVIALDTSTASMAAAVVHGNEVMGEVQSLAERNHSVHVVAHLKQLLASCGVTEQSLAGIAVGKGPGSYTGMRIAVSVAKTLAWVWKKPLVGVSSLEAIAYGALQRGIEALEASVPLAAHAENGEQWVLPIMDARRGQVYSSGFRMTSDGEWERWENDAVKLMHGWVDDVIVRAKASAELSSPVRKIWLAGDLSQHEAEAERLQQLGKQIGIEVARQPYVLEGRWIAYLGQQLLASGVSENVHTFAPNYTQLTEAEVKLKEKQAEEGVNG